MGDTCGKNGNNSQPITVLKIDEEIYRSLLTQTVKVHSVFAHALNLLVNESLVTLSSNSSFNKNHIIVDALNFEPRTMTVTSMLKPVFEGFSIDELSFLVQESSIVKASKYGTKYTLNEQQQIKAKVLLEWIGNQSTVSIMNFDETDLVFTYQFRAIYEFLEKESKETAERIIGLGIGLTPLGDDVLLGYILAKKSLDNDYSWFGSIVETAKRHTNMISYQSLKDVYDGYYSEQFIDMMDEFFNKTTLNHAKSVIHYGATSGAGILIGFIFGLLPQGGIRNECLESIRKHLL